MNSKTTRKKNENKENDDGLNVNPKVFVKFAKSNLFEDAVEKIFKKSLKRIEKNYIQFAKKYSNKNEVQKLNKEYIKKVVIFYFEREKKNLVMKNKEIEKINKKFKEDINKEITKNEKKISNFEIEISTIKNKFDIIRGKFPQKKTLSNSSINKIEKQSLLAKSNLTPKFNSIDNNEEDLLIKKLNILEEQQNNLKNEIKLIRKDLEKLSKNESKESYFKSENINENEIKLKDDDDKNQFKIESNEYFFKSQNLNEKEICSLISKPSLNQIEGEKKIKENNQIQESHLIEKISDKLSNDDRSDSFKSNLEIVKMDIKNEIDSDSVISNVSAVKSIKSMMAIKQDDRRISKDLFNSFGSFIPDQNELNKIDPKQLKIYLKIFGKPYKKKRKSKKKNINK